MRDISGFLSFDEQVALMHKLGRVCKLVILEK
jgi:hypothetical protein